jgi:hypothetical protein
MNALELIRTDLEKSWHDIFELSEGELRALIDPITGHHQYTTVLWSTKAKLTGNLDGISGNGEVVEIVGVTIIDNSGEEPLLHTTIDWSKVTAQLGVPLNRRILFAPTAPALEPHR